VDALVHADIDDVISHVGESVISDCCVRRRAEDREGCLVAQQMRERTCDRTRQVVRTRRVFRIRWRLFMPPRGSTGNCARVNRPARIWLQANP